MKLDAQDALDLLDWKRQVFGLYEVVRASPDPREAWEHWRATRDQLFREHPQSPLPEDERPEFAGCEYFDYDPQARVLGRIEPTEPVRRDVVTSTGAAFPFSKIGTVRFALSGEELALALLWNEGYGGGLFVSFQDGTSGEETYPAARYLLDTVTGAISGSMAASSYSTSTSPTTRRAPTTARGRVHSQRLRVAWMFVSARVSGHRGSACCAACPCSMSIGISILRSIAIPPPRLK